MPGPCILCLGEGPLGCCIAMDVEKGALLAWLSIVFFNRNASNRRELKQWLPNVPALGRMLACSSEFKWNEQCYKEVRLLGKLSGYPFETYLDQLELPVKTYGCHPANPIIVDSTDHSSSTDISSSTATNSSTARTISVPTHSDSIEKGSVDSGVQSDASGEERSNNAVAGSARFFEVLLVPRC